MICTFCVRSRAISNQFAHNAICRSGTTPLMCSSNSLAQSNAVVLVSASIPRYCGDIVHVLAPHGSESHSICYSFTGAELSSILALSCWGWYFVLRSSSATMGPEEYLSKLTSYTSSCSQHAFPMSSFAWSSDSLPISNISAHAISHLHWTPRWSVNIPCDLQGLLLPTPLFLPQNCLNWMPSHVCTPELLACLNVDHGQCRGASLECYSQNCAAPVHIWSKHRSWTLMRMWLSCRDFALRYSGIEVLMRRTRCLYRRFLIDN